MKHGGWVADTKCGRGHGAKQESSRRLGGTGFFESEKVNRGTNQAETPTRFLGVSSHQAAASPLKFKPCPLSFASCIRFSLKFLAVFRISLGLKLNYLVVAVPHQPQTRSSISLHRCPRCFLCFCASLHSLSKIQPGLHFLAHMSTDDRPRGDVVHLMPFAQCTGHLNPRSREE